MNDFTETLCKAIGTRSRELADHLGLKNGYWMIRKYCQALNASGWPLPAYLLPKVCIFLNDYTPIEYLANACGMITFRLPNPICKKANYDQLLATSREYGQLVKETSEALLDRHVTRIEAERVHRETLHLVTEALKMDYSISSQVEVKP
jgi:hypothetical protein